MIAVLQRLLETGTDAGILVVAAASLVVGARGTWHKAAPMLRPVGRAVRTWIVRDVLHRVEVLEDRATIIETRLDERQDR